MAQSAAAQLFATPELLELILLMHARRRVKEGFDWITQSPSRDLHIWQRIDKTTRNIIQGSSKLRCFMWLEPFPEGSKDAGYASQHRFHVPPGEEERRCDEDRLAPLWWLQRIMGDWLDTSEEWDVEGGSSLNIRFEEINVSNRDFELGSEFNDNMGPIYLSKAAQRPEASWRSIRMLRVPSNIKVTVIMSSLLVSLARLETWFEIDENTTLGDFYDWCSDFRKRDFDGYLATLIESLREGEKAGDGLQTEWTSGSWRASNIGG